MTQRCRPVSSTARSTAWQAVYSFQQLLVLAMVAACVLGGRGTQGRQQQQQQRQPWGPARAGSLRSAAPSQPFPSSQPQPLHQARIQQQRQQQPQQRQQQQPGGDEDWDPPFPPPSPVPRDRDIDPPALEDIKLRQVLFAGLVVVATAGACMYLRLGIQSDLFVATVRMTLQVLAFGYILSPAFSHSSWWLTLLLSVAMVALASFEAASRPHLTYRGMPQHVLASLAGGTAVLTLYGTLVVLPLWRSHQYILPLVGLLLAQAIDGVAVGLSTLLHECVAGREQVELMLALGASRSEAMAAVVDRALVAAIMPVIGQMSLLGLAGMPGVMAGQIIQGGDPVQASRLQLCVMLLACGACAASAIAAVLLAANTVVNDKHMLVLQVLSQRQHTEGLPSLVWHQLRTFLAAAHRVLLRLYFSCCRARDRPLRNRLQGAGWNGGGQGGYTMGQYNRFSSNSSPYDNSYSYYEEAPADEPAVTSPASLRSPFGIGSPSASAQDLSVTHWASQQQQHQQQQQRRQQWQGGRSTPFLQLGIGPPATPASAVPPDPGGGMGSATSSSRDIRMQVRGSSSGAAGGGDGHGGGLDQSGPRDSLVCESFLSADSRELLSPGSHATATSAEHALAASSPETLSGYRG